jgi:guanylate kinase
MARGCLFIISGPSGVGKSSLCERLLARYARLSLSVSYTTRAPRGQERDGVHYHFVTRARFEAMIAGGEFAEHAQVHGNFYGTSRAVVEAALSRGEDLLFDIDYQGAAQLKAAFPQEARAVLLVPPSMAALEARLRGRGTDAEEVIARRMAAARNELAQFGLFDYALLNDALEEAWEGLLAIYEAQRHLVSARRDEIEALLRG